VPTPALAMCFVCTALAALLAYALTLKVYHSERLAISA
jgi:hypothetical protein